MPVTTRRQFFALAGAAAVVPAGAVVVDDSSEVMWKYCYSLVAHTSPAMRQSIYDNAERRGGWQARQRFIARLYDEATKRGVKIIDDPAEWRRHYGRFTHSQHRRKPYG